MRDSTVTADVAAAFARVAQLLVAYRDVIDTRPEHDATALQARGWSDFLLGLSDAALVQLEHHGIDADWPQTTPASLRLLLAQVQSTCAVDALVPDVEVQHAPRRHERPRKQQQVDAVAELIAPLTRHVTRVVDVGSGHGHLTREIASATVVPVVGLERQPALAARAQALARDLRSNAPDFAISDVLSDGLQLLPGDGVVGLHACGELGDVIVRSAVHHNASAVVLIGCCLQKQRAPTRVPLCKVPDTDALTWPKPLLGLSNLSMRPTAVEAQQHDNLLARQRRLALHHLFLQDGLLLPLGAEMDGLNRRAAQRPLHELVARAFAARGLLVPSEARIDAASTWAGAAHARVRRLQLPRTLLGRVLEIFVALDRATYLATHGFAVQVGTAYADEVSARNLAVVGMR